MGRKKCEKNGHTEVYSDGRCATCARLRVERFKANNPESAKVYGKTYRSKNPDRVKLSQTIFKATKPEKIIEIRRAYKKRNPHKVVADCHERYASKTKSIPVWFNDFDRFAVEEAVDLCKRRAKVTAFEWQVDHIVPLRSKRVCGLHVCSNLAVIPAIENQRKNNRYWPGMP